MLSYRRSCSSCEFKISNITLQFWNCETSAICNRHIPHCCKETQILSLKNYNLNLHQKKLALIDLWKFWCRSQPFSGVRLHLEKCTRALQPHSQLIRNDPIAKPGPLRFPAMKAWVVQRLERQRSTKVMKQIISNTKLYMSQLLRDTPKIRSSNYTPRQRQRCLWGYLTVRECPLY